MVIGEHVCYIPPIIGKAFSQITTNMIISMEIRPGILLNGRVLHMALLRSLIKLICCYIYGKYSAAAVILRVDIPVINLVRFSNSLSM